MSVERQRRNNPNYGRGSHALAEGEVAQLQPAEVARRLAAAFRDANYSPPLLPTVALEVVTLSKDPKVDLAQVRKLIETDPLLAGKVIQLAQSSFYARGTLIRSLDDALVRLGTKTLADLFLQVAVTTRVFRAKGFEKPMDAIRRHSIGCAHLARKICQKIGFPEEYAFLCGLLHDCGMAAALIVLGDVPRGQALPPYESTRYAVESVHAAASKLLAVAWRLPTDVQLVLGNHHAFMIGGKMHPLLAALCVADGLIADAGLPAGGEHQPEIAIQAAHAVGINAAALADLRAYAKTLPEMVG